MVNCLIIFVTGWFCFVNSKFLAPTEKSAIEEIFEHDDGYEYIFSNLALEWDLAAAICQYEYEGMLATLETDALRKFAVEAMSESNMVLDGLWLGLQKINGAFTWLGVNTAVPDDEFTKCGNNSKVSYNCSFGCTNEMNCGALVRANHTELCLVHLSCEANRGFICKRPAGGTGPSTHGWIRLRYRLYKIFYKQLTYEDANAACIRHDKLARLAVVETFGEAQLLGRYLLVGRPSVERVWIGARWEEDFMQYSFESEPILLENSTNPSGYPPWRRQAMSIPLGCLLLDRHLSNLTYFVESDCDRLHYYMCYKMVDNETVDVCDVGDYDWRVYYNKSSWFKASTVCKQSAHSGRLAELERKDLKYFIHVMESSKRYLLHVWLGGYFLDGVWTWISSNRSLPRVEENGFPPWVVNRSYEEDVEILNLCLNIDRENALKPLFYGTHCNYAQTFICQYDQGTICSNESDSTTRSTDTTSTTTTTIPTKTTTTTPRTTTTSRTTTTTRRTTTTKRTTTTTRRTTRTTWTTTRRRTTTPPPTRPTRPQTTKKTKPTRPTRTRPTTAASTRKTPTTVKTRTTKRSRKTTRPTGGRSTTEGPVVLSTTTEWGSLRKRKGKLSSRVSAPTTS